MTEKDDLLEKLQTLLKHKKSNLYYASKLGVSVEEIEQLRKELKPANVNYYQVDSPEDALNSIISTTSTKFNVEEGTMESSIEVDFEPKAIEDLAKLHKIDTSVYTIKTYWSKLKSNGKFTSSLFAVKKEENSLEVFNENFKSFLKDFNPSPVIIQNEYTNNKPKISLILPKQDAHYNKLDINGKNNISKRFYKEQTSVIKMLEKAVATNFIDEIVYIVGSDQFNSEWTGLTTKGTNQQNILSYQESFTMVCNHEVEIINSLLFYGNQVKIVFIIGNHDEFVGWHLINWLESYYRDNKRLTFDSSTVNTKYHKYGTSAIMFNHGDVIKPKELAAKFPKGFKNQWSFCDNYYIFTGDRHHEMSLDMHGIKFYQVPQLSTATSKWDDKQGYIDGKAEMTAFVITKDNGMSDIYKDIL